MLCETFAETQDQCMPTLYPTFELHNKLKSRPDAKKWPAVPDTGSYHSIANGQNGKPEVRTFSCCCKGCLQGDEPFSNVVCPDEWKEYNFTTKKFGKASREWWLDTCKDQIHKIQENNGDESNQIIQQQVEWAAKNCLYECTQEL